MHPFWIYTGVILGIITMISIMFAIDDATRSNYCD